MKTIEELTAELEEQRKQNEAMNAKNRELLDEMKAVKRKNSEIDIDAYHKALDKVDALEADNAKLQGEIKLKGKDLEKLTASLSEKDGALQGLLIDQGLTQALTEAGVPANLLKYVKADLKSQAKLHGENGQYTAMIGDKPLNDFINEWKETDGKNVIIAPNNSGGGGGGGGTPPNNEDKPVSLIDMYGDMFKQ